MIRLFLLYISFSFAFFVLKESLRRNQSEWKEKINLFFVWRINNLTLLCQISYFVGSVWRHLFAWWQMSICDEKLWQTWLLWLSLPSLLFSCTSSSAFFCNFGIQTSNLKWSCSLILLLRSSFFLSVLKILLLLFYFYLLGSTAERFFCPVLGRISRALNLSPNVAVCLIFIFFTHKHTQQKQFFCV